MSVPEIGGLLSTTRELLYTAGANPSFRLEIGGLLSTTRELLYTAGANPTAVSWPMSRWQNGMGGNTWCRLQVHGTCDPG